MLGNVVDVIMTRITGESLMAKDTGSRERPSLDEVSRLAFHLYEKRGRVDGHDVEDWLLAEQELARHYA
jgi:hypothetical protein